MTLMNDPTLGELDIRAQAGGNVLVIERGATSHPNPPPSFAIKPGDRLLVLGGAENLLRVRRLLEQAEGS